MKTIETTQAAGPDKLLHLTIPVEEANREYRMVIVLAPEPDSSIKRGLDHWSEGYIENTFGSIQDESFIRHPQCPI